MFVWVGRNEGIVRAKMVMVWRRGWGRREWRPKEDKGNEGAGWKITCSEHAVEEKD